MINERTLIFKISRISDVEVTDDVWTEETSHEKLGMDVFRMNGKTPMPIRLQMTFMAKNLLIEEYPLAAKYLKRDGANWILDTVIYRTEVACRFVAGLMSEVTILEGDQLKTALQEYGKKYFN